jgi:hypothetical protein
MKKPPRRMFRIAATVATGKSQTETAGKFGVTVQAVHTALHRVQLYQAGQGLLHDNPLSIQGLAQTGIIRESAARALTAEGITDLRQLAEQGKRFMNTVDGIGPISRSRIMALLKRHAVSLAD